MLLLFMALFGVNFASKAMHLSTAKKIDKKICTIKFFDKEIRVTRQTLQQFGLYQDEKKFQQRASTENRKAKEFFWDITEALKGFKIESHTMEKLLEIDDGVLDPSKLDRDALSEIFKAARLLGNQFLMARCARALMQKEFGKVNEDDLGKANKDKFGKKECCKDIYLVQDKLLPGLKGLLFEDIDFFTFDFKGERSISLRSGWRTDNFIRICDWQAGPRCTKRMEIKDQKDLGGRKIRTMVLHPKKNLFVIGGDRGLLQLWDMDVKQFVADFEGHKGVVTSVAISPDGETLVSGDIAGNVFLWEFEDGTKIGSLEKHKGRINKVLVTPDGKEVVSCGKDGRICVWDLEKKELIGGFEKEKVSIKDISLDSFGKTLVASLKGGLLVFDLKKMKIEKDLKDTKSERSLSKGYMGDFLSIDPYGKRVFVVDKTTKVVQLCYLEKERNPCEGFDKIKKYFTFKGVQFNRNGRWLVFYGGQGLSVFDSRTYEDLSLEQIYFCLQMKEKAIKKRLKNPGAPDTLIMGRRTKIFRGSDDYKMFYSLPPFLREKLKSRFVRISKK